MVLIGIDPYPHVFLNVFFVLIEVAGRATGDSWKTIKTSQDQLNELLNLEPAPKVTWMILIWYGG